MVVALLGAFLPHATFIVPYLRDTLNASLLEIVITQGIVIAGSLVLFAVGIHRIYVNRRCFPAALRAKMLSIFIILFAVNAPFGAYAFSVGVAEYKEIQRRFIPMTVKSYGLGGVVLLEHSPVGGESAVLDRYLTEHPETKAVLLNSLGGWSEEALRIAATIKSHNLSTIILNQAVCNSACALIFVAGKERVMEEGAIIGFHQAADLEGNPAPLAHQAVLDDYLKEQGVSNDVIAKARATPHRKLHELNAEQAVKEGVANKIGAFDAVSGLMPASGTADLLSRFPKAGNP